MADHTKIEWTEATWSPITGCSVHSAGCTNCYAMKWAGTRLRHHPSRAGLTIDTKAGPVWNGKVRFNEEWLTQPLQWKRPRMIFVCAHADLFHEAVPDEWIDRIFAVMALCPQHTFQVLTKRSDRMRAYFAEVDDRTGVPLWAMRVSGKMERYYADTRDSNSAAWAIVAGHCLPNVWLGVSVENQAAADERIPDLLATPAAVRWLSCEPLLGPVTLTMLHYDSITNIDALSGRHGVGQVSRGVCEKIDWVVVGGESGTDARPMHPDWARTLRDQCKAAGTPFFFKQWGNWGPDDGPPKDARDRAFEGTVSVAVRIENDWRYFDNWIQPPIELADGHGEWVYKFGKKAAGRLLDGKLHDAMPARL